MGISAQQHRVYTGLFDRCRYVKHRVLVGGVRSADLSRRVFAMCLGIIYFYILLFIMFISVDCNNRIIYKSPPTIRTCQESKSLMNLYMIFVLMYVYEDGLGLKALTDAIIKNLLRWPSRVTIPLAITPSCLLKLAVNIINRFIKILLSGIVVVNNQ